MGGMFQGALCYDKEVRQSWQPAPYTTPLNCTPRTGLKYAELWKKKQKQKIKQKNTGFPNFLLQVFSWIGRETKSLIKRIVFLLFYCWKWIFKRLWLISDLRVRLCTKLPKEARMTPSLPPRPPNLLLLNARSEQGTNSWSPLAPNRPFYSIHQRHGPSSRSFNHALQEI